MQKVVLPLFSFSAWLSALFAESPVELSKFCVWGTPKSGMSLIFKCLFLWNIFLICDHAKQGPSPNCMVLWSKASIVWVSLLHNRKHFCVNFYELFLQVSSWVHCGIKAENGVVYPRNTQTSAFIGCVFPCFFFIFVTLLQCYDLPLHFLSAFLSFSSMWVRLFWINMIMVAEFSLYSFPWCLEVYYIGWGCFYPQHFLLFGTNFMKVPVFNCKTFAISIPSCRHWSSLLCNVTVCSFSACWLQAKNTWEFQLYFHIIFLCLVIPMFQTLVLRPYVPSRA